VDAAFSEREPTRAAAPAGERDGSTEGRGQLAIVSLSHAVQHVYVSGLAVVYPFAVAGLHVSYAALGIVLGVSGVIGGLFQGLAGAFERVSARLLLTVQNVGLALASLIGALSPGFDLFGAARAFGSAVSWPQHPVGSAVLAERYPRRRAYALSWHVAGGSIGTAAVPIVVSALIAAFGWRVAVGFLAAPIAIGGLLVAWRLRDPARPRDAQLVRRSHDLAALRMLLHRREVVGALIAGTVAAGGRGLGTLAVYVPAYLKSSLHLAPVTIGVLFTVLLVGSIGGPVVAGHVADRLGRRRVLVVVYLVGAATIAAYVRVGRGLVALALAGLLVGVFAYAESPLLQAVFSDGVAGVEQQGAFGYFFAISYGVGSLWTIALGFVIDHLGFHWAFDIMALSFVGAAVAVALLGPVHHDHDARDDAASGTESAPRAG
jgi:MFS family permease